jgi:hypothetical protein
LALQPQVSAWLRRRRLNKLFVTLMLRGRKLRDMLATPGFVISWKATKVEVAKSGDLAFVSGTMK